MTRGSQGNKITVHYCLHVGANTFFSFSSSTSGSLLVRFLESNFLVTNNP
ncbi:hypothetical protein ACE6H2_015689 [Prunus campanulata]